TPTENSRPHRPFIAATISLTNSGCCINAQPSPSWIAQVCGHPQFIDTPSQNGCTICEARATSRAEEVPHCTTVGESRQEVVKSERRAGWERMNSLASIIGV